MSTRLRLTLQIVIGVVVLSAIGPVGYLVYSVSPGFLLAIGLAFWVDAVIVAVGLRLIFSLNQVSESSTGQHAVPTIGTTTGRTSSLVSRSDKRRAARFFLVIYGISFALTFPISMMVGTGPMFGLMFGVFFITGLIAGGLWLWSVTGNHRGAK